MVSPVPSCATPSSSTTTTCSLTNSSTKPPSSSTRSPETHVCPYPACAKSFSKKYNLKAHLRLHTGEQPFECDRPDCNKKFKWRSSLSSHTVWHSRKDKTNTTNPTASTSSSSSSSSSSATTTVTNNINSNNNNNNNNNSNNTVSSSALTECSSRPTTANPTSTTASSAAPNRKRPRASRPTNAASRTLPTSTSSVDLTKLGKYNNNNCRRTPSKPPNKKQKKSCKASTQAASQAHVVPLGTIHDVLPAPSSPLTDAASFFDYSSGADSPMDSQPMLELDEFSEHVLSLDVRHADAPCLQMQIGLEDVASIMDDGDQCGGLFSQYGSGTCGNLTALDTRFGPFDLDNLQAFGMNATVEGL